MAGKNNSLSSVLGRKAPTLPMTGCHLYQAPAAPIKARQHTQHRPHRPAPVDHGCHGYEAHGGMFTRCPAHAPAGGRDLGAVLGACVACSVN